MLAELNAKRAVVLNYGSKTAVMTFGDPPQMQSFADFKNRYSNRFVPIPLC